ncbi:MAG TPA: flippase [Candidatus Acidoferrales bacterium]|nr:flippase [Candidatus Acidoferrales bacterium]
MARLLVSRCLLDPHGPEQILIDVVAAPLAFSLVNLSLPNLMSDTFTRGRRLIARNSAFNLAGQLVPMVVGVITIPIIVRGLGHNGYGIFSIAIMALGYFSIFDLGLGRATVKFVAENNSPESVHRIPELVWTSFSLLAGLGCIGGALAALFVPYAVTHLFKMPASFFGEARTSLFILCAAMPIMLLNDALRGVLEAAQRFDLVNYVKVPSSFLFYSVAAIVIPFGVHVPGVVLLLVLIRLTSSFAYLWLCFRVFPNLRARPRVSRASLKPLAVFGGWIMVSNVTAPIFGYLERFMIASVLSVGMLTFYSAPYDLVSKMLVFPASIIPSLFPYFSYHGTRGRDEVSEVTSRTIQYLLLVLTPIVAIFLVFARPILHLWLGPQFAEISTVPMQIVSFIFFLNAFAMIPFTSVQALGRPDLKAILDIVVLPVYAFSAWWFMRRMGINGAALAKLLVTVLDLTCLYTFASHLKAFHLRHCLSGHLSRAIGTSAILLLAVVGLQLSRASIPMSIFIVGVLLLAYAALFWTWVINRRDRDALLNMAQQFLALLRRRQTPDLLQSKFQASD